MTHLIERFTEHLKKGKYNLTTITAYRQAIFVFFNHFRDYPQNKINEEVISSYLAELTLKKGNSHEAIQAGKAIILFYDIIFNKQLKIKATGKIKEEQSFDIFTKEEVKQIFDNTKNLKHKLLLILVYNSGLKINEVISLELDDLDLENDIITIRHKNPKKNRLLRLAPNTKDLINKYLEKFKPTKILFPGSNLDSFYSARNIQMFFQKILQEAGIQKEATLNTLRHSFAIHSLELGLDLHVLQKLLGHNNIQTTSIYSQYVEAKTENIRTPLEFMEI